MAEAYLRVETDAALESLCRPLRAAEWLALDTEFIRERTYYPQLCLVQVATPDIVACVDVLAIKVLDPLFAVLYDPAILKVLHSARQDLELFFHLTGRVPTPVFDTQLAASFAGFPDQAGYATVVQALLGIALDKSHTRTDWSQRPLPAAALDYAADDVRYLREIYLHLRSELQTRARLTWLDKDSSLLTDPATYRPDPETAWRRLRGLQRLRPRQLTAGKALAAWRERMAMENNLPRQWVLKDEVLTDLARQLPSTPATLLSVRGLNEALVRKYGEALLGILATAPAQSTGTAVAPTEARLSAQEEALVDALMALVRFRGAEAGVSPAQLATRSELQRLARGKRDVPVLQGWRLETAGRELLRLLDGEITLAVSDGVLTPVAVDKKG